MKRSQEGDIHLAFRQWANKETRLERHLQAHPEDRKALVDLAALRVARGEYGGRFARSPESDFDQAERALNIVLADWPLVAADPITLRALAWRGRLGAVRLHRKRLGVDPTPATWEAYAAAEADLSAALALPHAQRYRAHLRILRGDHRASLGLDPTADYRLAEADGIACPTTECAMYRGEARLRLGRPAQAATDFSQVMKSDSGRAAWALERRAQAHLAQGHLAAALQDIEDSVVRDGARYEAYWVRSDVQAALGRPQEAAASLRKVIAAEPALAAPLAARVQELEALALL